MKPSLVYHNMQPFPVPAGLHLLRQRFRANGFDLRLVGGCVRDWLRAAGLNDPRSFAASHDIDLCTDATPDEQRALYLTYAVHHIATGLHHGTWTVVLDGIRYEISSLRSDSATASGTPCYTRDWAGDLARRDLTINAMLSEFDGTLFDPQQGHADLLAGIVRFVGEAGARIREDPLRILRWFRFHASIGRGRFVPSDVVTAAAIRAHRDDLAGVSPERIWSEIRLLLADPQGLLGLMQIILYGVAQPIGLPVPGCDQPSVSIYRLEQAHRHTKDPVSLLAAYLGSPALIAALGAHWRWSNADRQQGAMIAGIVETGLGNPLVTAKRLIAETNVPPYWVAESLRVMGQPALAATITAWGVLFPVSGADLLASGLPAGPGIGQTLTWLRQAWADSDYTLSRTALLAMLPVG